MRRFILLFFIFIFLGFSTLVWAGTWQAIGLTGGGNALDGIDTTANLPSPQNVVNDGHIAFVWNDSGTVG